MKKTSKTYKGKCEGLSVSFPDAPVMRSGDAFNVTMVFEMETEKGFYPIRMKEATAKIVKGENQ